MSTAREILRQADDLKRQQARMDLLTAAIEHQLTQADPQVCVGGAWYVVPASVMRVLAEAVLLHQNQITAQVDALEARVQVVEP